MVLGGGKKTGHEAGIMTEPQSDSVRVQVVSFTDLY